jgi:transcription antitermination factor NusG
MEANRMTKQLQVLAKKHDLQALHARSSPTPERYNFYCARSHRQKEEACAALLIRHGVFVFLPIETKWKRAADKRGPRESYEVVMFPPYLFIGFAQGREDWNAVMSCRLVSELLCDEQGTPLKANAEQMRRFMARAENAVTASQRRLAAAALKAGDTVTFTTGAYAGKTIKISQIKGKQGQFLTEMFGAKDVAVTFSLEDVEAAA